jgi:DNA-binding winged helix-turn-helix (wHTH) protein
LQVHISALRKALGSDVIATVHGRGYKYAGMQGPLRLKSFSQTPHPPRARPVSR